MKLPLPGQTAPDFALLDEEGQSVRLSDFRGRKVVLFFYPRANTPGCTKEACGFRDDYADFERRGVVILGISPDEVNAQAKFRQKYEFPFHLLADADHQVAELYGVWGLKKFMGREYMGVKRTTFLIDEEGQVEKIFERLKPADHSKEVLAYLDEAVEAPTS
jgi:peroxiredoxin Q/BCP